MCVCTIYNSVFLNVHTVIYYVGIKEFFFIQIKGLKIVDSVLFTDCVSFSDLWYRSLNEAIFSISAPFAIQTHFPTISKANSL